ncbi:MAG: LamG-like jellyroll fold domain-containing protein [Tepidisphaeraceae bacterium]
MSKRKGRMDRRSLLRSPPSIGAHVVEALERRIQLSAALFSDAFNYPLGDFDNAGLSLNGGAAISQLSFSNQLQLADGGTGESRSAFTSQEFGVSTFSTNFNVQFSGPSTSGFAFVLQGSGAGAVGTGNAGSDGIAKSVAVEFLATASGTETELNVNGVATTGAFISPSSIDLSNARALQISIEYDGSTLQVTETDGQTTLTPATSTQTYTNVNIPTATGGAAYLGFTGSDGSSGVSQVIQNWEFADIPRTDTDIGSPTATGNSTYTAGGQYTVHGAGTGAGSTSDQFHFVSEPITGDSTIVGQLTAPSSGSAADGLMLREGTSASAAFAEVDLTTGGVQFISRSNAGAADSVSSTIAASGTQWLKLVRDGPTVSGYISTTANGAWTLVGTAPVNGSTNALMGLAVSSGSSSTLATANFSSVSVSENPSIGLDTSVAAPETQPIWVDIVKQSGGFYNISNNDLAPANANGWPTTDFRIPNLISPTAQDAGVYSLIMKVSQNPTVTFSGATLSNASYSSSTDTYTASVTIPGSGNVSVTVTNTGSGITSLQIIRPGYSTTNPPVFTNSYISFLQSLHPTVLRFMNWTQTNNNPVMTWAQRSMPSNATQTEFTTLYNYNGTVDGNGYLTGVCWEYAIMLANAVHADMWINIPAQANDNYVDQLASLIKNGDTINGVSYPALNPDLNVYIEYSNETWNAGFEVYQYATDAAVAEVVADANSGTPSNLNYDNLSLAKNPDGTYVNASTWQQRWCARRLMQISNDFESVFGQSAINTRIRPVLSNIPIPSVQAGQLAYINAVFGAPSKFFYAVAAATYANMNGPYNGTNTLNGGNSNPNLTATQVLQDLSANAYALAYELYDPLYAVAQQYGLQMDGYESGPDLSGFQDTATSKIQAETDPRFTTFLEQYYQAWFACGGGTIIYYNGAAKPWGDEYGDFQISDSQADLFDAKEIGFRDAVSAERDSPAPVALSSLSATDISSTQVNLSWGSASAGATEYRVEASTTSAFSANLVTQIAPANSTGWSFTGLSPGISYYFQVLAASPAGDAGASSSASATTSGTAAIPAVPFDVSATAVSSSQINVSWGDSSLIENGYTITVATNPAFTQIVQTLTASAGATTIPVYDLNGLTDYYVEVAAFNAAGASAAAAALPTVTPLPIPLAQYAFNETSGSTVLDSGSGTAANGTIVGGVTRIAGPYNGDALAFDGSTGYVNLGTPAKLNLEGQITIGAWIKPTAVSSQGDIISQDWDGLDTPFFLDLSSTTTVNFGTNRYNGSGAPNVEATGVASASLTNGQWHYIAGVYDGQYFKVYIDGVLAGETGDPYGVTYGTEPTNIGRDSNDGGGSYNYFDGDIADLEIFSNGLSSADIAKISQPWTDTWTGQASTAWSNANNWSASATPGGFTRVVINGGAVAASSAISIAALVLNGGSLQLAAGSGGSSVTSLALAANAALNLNNNLLFIDFAGGTDPISTVAGYIKSGYNAGGWNGLGITSTAAQTPTNGLHYGLGYADGKDGVVTSLASGQIEVMYTLLGDANLDSYVNSADLAIVETNFNQSVTGWDRGDFYYDGIVNAPDLAALAANFNQGDNLAAVANAPLAAAVPTSPKSRAVSVSKAVARDTTNGNLKATAVTTYAASVVTVPTSGSAATPQNTSNKDAKFLADR